MHYYLQYSCYLDVFFLHRETSEKEDPLVEAADDDDVDKQGVMASRRQLQDRVDSALQAVINQVNRVFYSHLFTFSFSQVQEKKGKWRTNVFTGCVSLQVPDRVCMTAPSGDRSRSYIHPKTFHITESRAAGAAETTEQVPL